MEVIAKDLKQWLSDEISPLAWVRILVRITPHLREQGFTLSQLEQPDSSITFNRTTIGYMSKASQEIYSVAIPDRIN